MSTKGYLLIVEDDPDIRGLLDTTLQFKGYRVIATQNGRVALETIQKERPTLIVADIMMPELDGFGLVHRLRLNPETRTIPVIFITATYVTLEDRDFSLRIGATRFIQKPVDMDNLLTQINELLMQDPLTIPQLLDEFSFYEGYRKRLETKLDEKVKQIVREEHLLSTPSKSDEQDIHMSLRHARREKEEIQDLLAEIYKHMQRISDEQREETPQDGKEK